jgi:hypothetical protein
MIKQLKEGVTVSFNVALGDTNYSRLAHFTADDLHKILTSLTLEMQTQPSRFARLEADRLRDREEAIADHARRRHASLTVMRCSPLESLTLKQRARSGIKHHWRNANRIVKVCRVLLKSNISDYSERFFYADDTFVRKELCESGTKCKSFADAHSLKERRVYKWMSLFKKELVDGIHRLHDDCSG